MVPASVPAGPNPGKSGTNTRWWAFKAATWSAHILPSSPKPCRRTTGLPEPTSTCGSIPSTKVTILACSIPRRGTGMHMTLGLARWLLLAALVLEQRPLAQTTERTCAFTGIRRGETLACSGGERTLLGRTYCVHVPAAPRAGLPVVLLLHGYTSNGETQSRYFDLDSAVERRGFILVKPNGTPDAAGRRYWNAGRHT